jgi:DNA-binding transcriptional regulator YiaG
MSKNSKWTTVTHKKLKSKKSESSQKTTRSSSADTDTYTEAAYEYVDYTPKILRKRQGSNTKTGSGRKPGTSGNGGFHKSKEQQIEEMADKGIDNKVGHAIGKKIQQARAKKNIKRKDFAKSLNVKESVIADYESGKANKDGRLLSRIKSKLGV